MNTQQEWFDTSDCDFCSNKSEKMNLSASRPPQHKKANESSQQVASTTAALEISELVPSLWIQMSLGGEGYEDNYTLDHKPPSNISNGTATTDATVVANVTASNTTFTTPPYTFTDKGLTESVLAKHQHELDMLSPGDMTAWLEGTCPEYSRRAVAHHKKERRRRPVRSKHSQASDASYDFVAAPSTDAGQSLDILAAGALFNEQAFNPSIYTSHLDMRLDM